MIRENRVLSTLRGGGRVVGTFAKMHDPASVEILGLAGFEFVVLDTEHASMDRQALVDLLRAADRASSLAVLQCDRFPGGQMAARFGEHLPGAQFVRSQKQPGPAPARARPTAQQPGQDHAGIIQDQRVAPDEQLRQVPDVRVIQRVLAAAQAGGHGRRPTARRQPARDARRAAA